MVEFIKKNKKLYNLSNWQGGKTSEVYIYPENTEYKKRNFEFRFSYASVELAESTFTLLKGFNRILIPTKQGITLLNNSKRHNLKLEESFYFNGGEQTTSIGKSEDVNLIYQPQWHASMQVIKESSKIFSTAEFVGIFSLNGSNEILVDQERVKLLEKEFLLIKNFSMEKLLLEFSLDNNNRIVIFKLKKGKAYG